MRLELGGLGVQSLLASAPGRGLGDLADPANIPFVGDMLAGLPGWLVWPVLMLGIAGALIMGYITVFSLLAVYAERKISAFMQSRLGPTEVGPYGLLQTLADGVKLLGKEDIIPKDSDKALFIIGPIFVFTGVFISYVCLPFGRDLIAADLNIGLIFLAAVASVEVIGILMAGWASNNKWALFGTMRLITQLVSYEIPIGIAFVTIIAISGSFSLQDVTHAQEGWIWNWFLFRNPFLFVGFFVYYVASLAETKRAPFDLPEAESELVAGFHTEYSGMRFSIFFLAEYAAMYVVGALAAVLFLGGWYTGIGPVDGWMMAAEGWGRVAANLIGFGAITFKSWFLVAVMMWLRWTLPRIRLDQVMYVCLKVLLPFSFVILILSTLWELAIGPNGLIADLSWWPIAQFGIVTVGTVMLFLNFMATQRPYDVPDDFQMAKQAA